MVVILAAATFRSPAPASGWLATLGWLGALVGFLPLAMAYVVWGERKVAGRFQDRVGPNRVGPFGLLQSIADAVKLLTKEPLVPAGADRVAHALAPVAMLIPAFLALAVVPFGSGLAAADPPAGLIYLVAATSFGPIGLFLAGWGSRNKFSLLGAMRAVAQLVSYEVPLVLATVPAVLWAGSLRLMAIFDRQVDLGWFLFSPPGIVGFLILTVSGIAEVNRAPFDLPEAESELVSGYHTEYSGIRFALFMLAEYLGIFGVACLGSALYLGGGTLPFAGRWQVGAMGVDSTLGFIMTNASLVFVYSIKILAYIFAFFWIRATLPRLRVDRLMDFAWKSLIPLALMNLATAAAWYELAIRPEHPRVVLAWLVTGSMAAGSVAAVAAFHAVARAAGPATRPAIGGATP